MLSSFPATEPIPAPRLAGHIYLLFYPTKAREKQGLYSYYCYYDDDYAYILLFLGMGCDGGWSLLLLGWLRWCHLCSSRFFCCWSRLVRPVWLCLFTISALHYIKSRIVLLEWICHQEDTKHAKPIICFSVIFIISNPSGTCVPFSLDNSLQLLSFDMRIVVTTPRLLHLVFLTSLPNFKKIHKRRLTPSSSRAMWLYGALKLGMAEKRLL